MTTSNCACSVFPALSISPCGRRVWMQAEQAGRARWMPGEQAAHHMRVKSVSPQRHPALTPDTVACF